MAKKMKAAVFVGPEKILIENIDKPECDNGSIIVRVEACGICGSDIRNFHRGLRYGIKNQVMGHEISGIVEELGNAVNCFKTGDRVAIASDIGCGKCYYCLSGHINLCVNHRMVGSHIPGGFAEYIKITPELLRSGMMHKIPEGMTFEEATLAEPLSAVINVQKESHIGLGDTVLIFGDGPIGCMHLEIARAGGADRIIMVGLNKLSLAAVFNPEYLLDAGKIDPVKKTLEITGGIGADVAICANPVAQTQEQAIESVRKKGRVIFFGGLPEKNPFSVINSNLIHYNEISVVGSFSSPSHTKKLALEAIKKKKISPEKYINKIVNLDSIVEGFEAAEKGSALKVIVKPWI